MRACAAWVVAGLAAPLLAANATTPPASAVVAPNTAAWPSRPLRMVVPYPPGSTPDLIARYVGDRLSRTLGQPVVVDNRVGAGGSIGTGHVARAKADGYTLLLTVNGPLVTAPLLYSKLDYDPERDLVAIALVATSPSVLVVDARLPVRTVAELRDYALARPGKVVYGSVGKGSSAHLTMETFKRHANVELLHVPYTSYAQVVTAMMGGHVHAAFMVPGSAMPQVRAGKLRALAMTGPARSMLLPNLPTMKEVGFRQLVHGKRCLRQPTRQRRLSSACKNLLLISCKTRRRARPFKPTIFFPQRAR
jgi:tripartite-type tricarboxylate transporter receptor subunit TctC